MRQVAPSSTAPHIAAPFTQASTICEPEHGVAGYMTLFQGQRALLAEVDAGMLPLVDLLTGGHELIKERLVAAIPAKAELARTPRGSALSLIGRRAGGAGLCAFPGLRIETGGTRHPAFSPPAELG
jgi:hypothetical protein